MRVLRDRRFRALWIGQSVSCLGDQFHLLALPWLVLALTHDPTQLGLVLAAAGVPRAVLMLVGGVWADHRSPRSIMLASDIARAAITALLAVMVATGHAALWMVYALAVSFGVVAGFFLPAQQTAVPRLVADADLEPGNGLLMGAQALAGFVGPALAGSLLALWGVTGPAATPATWRGLGAAFGIDAATFVLSAVSLLFVGRLAGSVTTRTHPARDLADGLRFVTGHPLIRVAVVILGAANLLAIGAFNVGIPILAVTRFPGATVALAALIAATALGNVIGMALGAALPRPGARALGVATTAVLLSFGGSFAVLAVTSSLALATIALGLTGVLNGYMALTMMSTVQRTTPGDHLGRVMSVITLAMVGLGPPSQVIAGPVANVSLTLLFGGCSAGLVVTALYAFARRRVWGTPVRTSSEDREAAPAMLT